MAVEDTEPIAKAGQPNRGAERCMLAAASWREDVERKSASSKFKQPCCLISGVMNLVSSLTPPSGASVYLASIFSCRPLRP